MGNIFGSFNTGLTGLFTAQIALENAGHNVANVNTPGYSAQRLELSSRRPEFAGVGYLGRGVTTETIRRVHDRFLEHQIRRQNEHLGDLRQRVIALEQLEASFNDISGTGLKDQIDRFFRAWHDLSANPEDISFRTNVVLRSESLATTFRDTATRLTNLRKALDESIKVRVEQINGLARQIAELNLRIAEAEGAGHPANDLRDQRSVRLDELASYVEINDYLDQDGLVTVQIVGSGAPLIVGVKANTLVLQRDPSNSNLYDIQLDMRGSRIDVTDTIGKGELGGLLAARDRTIQQRLTDLDAIAAALVSAVNTQHAAGTDLDGNPGGNFFLPVATASTIQVDPAITGNLRLIAAAQSPFPGDNRNAVAIAGLQTALLMNGGTTSIDDYYNAMISSIGNEILEAQNLHDTGEFVMGQLENRRDSISGVSLDEEAANMIRFQRAFQASARFINVIDGLTDILINSMVRR